MKTKFILLSLILFLPFSASAAWYLFASNPLSVGAQLCLYREGNFYWDYGLVAPGQSHVYIASVGYEGSNFQAYWKTNSTWCPGEAFVPGPGESKDVSTSISCYSETYTNYDVNVCYTNNCTDTSVNGRFTIWFQNGLFQTIPYTLQPGARECFTIHYQNPTNPPTSYENVMDNCGVEGIPQPITNSSPIEPTPGNDNDPSDPPSGDKDPPIYDWPTNIVDTVGRAGEILHEDLSRLNMELREFHEDMNDYWESFLNQPQLTNDTQALLDQLERNRTNTFLGSNSVDSVTQDEASTDSWSDTISGLIPSWIPGGSQTPGTIPTINPMTLQLAHWELDLNPYHHEQIAPLLSFITSLIRWVALVLVALWCYRQIGEFIQKISASTHDGVTFHLWKWVAKLQFVLPFIIPILIGIPTLLVNWVINSIDLDSIFINPLLNQTGPIGTGCQLLITFLDAPYLMNLLVFVFAFQTFLWGMYLIKTIATRFLIGF